MSLPMNCMQVKDIQKKQQLKCPFQRICNDIVYTLLLPTYLKNEQTICEIIKTNTKAFP